MSQVSRV